jgi:hypothetical protein
VVLARSSSGLLGVPGGWVAQVRAAGEVEGLFGDADRGAAWQDGRPVGSSSSWQALTLIRKAPRSCSIVPTDPADLEMLDSVLIMLERSCGKLARSLSSVRKISEPALRHLE